MSDFIRIPECPVPEGATVEDLATPDGARLRVAALPCANARGTVALLAGRSEFIEKYFETAEDLRARGFAVAMMDWRGQGLSSRALPISEKGHITDFGTYAADLRLFMDRYVQPQFPGPYVLVAHSMGGMAAIRFLIDGDDRFACAALSAPMLRLFPSRSKRWAARLYARIACAVGAPRESVVGVKEYSLEFEGNELTNDRTRHERFRKLQAAAPGATIGSPTYAWLNAAFAAMDEIQNPGVLERIKVPTLIVSAENDTIVDPSVHEGIAARIPGGRYHQIKGAKHEILMETDAIRAEFWAQFDDFVGKYVPPAV